MENFLYNYIIIPLWVYLIEVFMPNQKNWLHQTLDWIWDKLLGTLWTYIIVTPYIFSKEKIIQSSKAIYYFLLPKKYTNDKELSIISFFKDSWHYSLSKTISIKFWAYFITGIVVFGGVGVWLEVVDLLVEYHKNSKKTLNYSDLNSALLFYITTLLGGISSQVFLDDDIPKNIKWGSWLLIILVYFFTAGVAYTKDDFPGNSDGILIICLILTILSLSIAWLINVFNPSLGETSVSNAALGGDNGIPTTSAPSLPVEGNVANSDNDPLKGNFDNLKA
ncbi:hypothetical protein [Acinetobacter venetianus]|uniref:hypothetical protein n=1 Tax=Acinetobacter venetianus TaxID=52133 RepID=UPI0007783073|nr:hypothetical protein [Acinetobacter venetianus]KXZ62325.1 hypothetical protein AVENLUH7437_03444 [Acinetobacter venetianus]